MFLTSCMETSVLQYFSFFHHLCSLRLAQHYFEVNKLSASKVTAVTVGFIIFSPCIGGNLSQRVGGWKLNML